VVQWQLALVMTVEGLWRFANPRWQFARGRFQ
jgi:hypothetical protein